MKQALSLTTAVMFFAFPVLLQASDHPAVKIEGHYEYRTDSKNQKMIGDKVCLFPSPSYYHELPNFAGNGKPKFCFRNTADALTRLKVKLAEHGGPCGVMGVASVDIVKYEPYQGDGDGFGTASLGRVWFKADPPSKIPCSK